MTGLFTYLESISPLSAASRLLLQDALTPLEIKKNEYLLKPGDACKAIFYISQGYCRAFYEKNGEEINTAFYFENDFATNLKSLTQNTGSEYAIQACEPLIAIRLDKTKLLLAYEQSQEIESMGRKLLEILVTRQEEHADLFKLLTAQQRYEHLQKKFPALLQRVSLSRLSSYIGISRETLSRIRGRK